MKKNHLTIFILCVLVFGPSLALAQAQQVQVAPQPITTSGGQIQPQAVTTGLNNSLPTGTIGGTIQYTQNTAQGTVVPTQQQVVPASGPAGGAANGGNGTFVPLTNLPGLTGLADASSLPAFFNYLYKICIGAAAVLAVLQIMRAGVMYMGGDSVTEKREARGLIGMSIAGLLLVLSPVIVFSIINPDILSLKIGGIDQLKPGALQQIKSSQGLPTGNQIQQTIKQEQGDGTCTADCAAGTVCSKGACVIPAPDSSCTPITSGTVITDAQYTCCATQKGCSVQVVAGQKNPVPVCVCSQ